MTWSFILIHLPVHLPHFQQLLKHLHPLRLLFSRIHQLLTVLTPRPHVALLRDKLGWPAVIGRQEVHQFTPFGKPEFALDNKQQSISPNTYTSSNYNSLCEHPIASLMHSTIYFTSSSVTYGPAGRQKPTLNKSSSTPFV